MTARQLRLLHALLRHPWVTREAADRIAHASNSPEVVAQLRHQHAVGIECVRATVTDTDGKKVRPGRYRLTSKGRLRAAKLLARYSS